MYWFTFACAACYISKICYLSLLYIASYKSRNTVQREGNVLEILYRSPIVSAIFVCFVTSSVCPSPPHKQITARKDYLSLFFSLGGWGVGGGGVWVMLRKRWDHLLLAMQHISGQFFSYDRHFFFYLSFNGFMAYMLERKIFLRRLLKFSSYSKRKKSFACFIIQLYIFQRIKSVY